MYKLIILFLTLFFGINTGYSQKSGSDLAPVKWERYRAEQKISVLFPKMPVRFLYDNNCSEILRQDYLVYSLDIVYGMNIYSRQKRKLPDFCPVKAYFDKNSFSERIGQLGSMLGSNGRKDLVINNKKAVFLKNARDTYWLFNDPENERWIELFTINGAEDEQTVNDFAGSLEFADDSAGIEIGEGAPRMLGDELPAEESLKQAEREKADQTDRQLVILYKTAPRYTDLAREKNTQGTVKLRVTFLGNGTIGSVSVVEALPDGLTEQAIRAAQRLVFLPARREGKRYSVTKTVQYNFSIY